MIRTIDKRITGLYQALVNASGKKPRWWGEQCAYLLLLAAMFSTQRKDFYGPAWLHWVLIGGIVLIAGSMWIESKSEALWAIHQQSNSIMLRAVWVLMFCDDLARLIWGTPRLDTFTMGTAFVSLYYFLTCEDPPPPKPRTRTKLAGNH